MALFRSRISGLRGSFLLLLAALAPAASLVADSADAQTNKAKAGARPAPSASASGSAVVDKDVIPPASKAGPAPKADEMWVAATTDDMIALLEKRAIRDGLKGGKEAIGAIMAIPQIADDARAGAARAALERIAKALSADKKPEARELAGEAATLARAIAPDAGAKSSRPEDAKLGLVSAWRLAGPFKDMTGKGLKMAEGPEIGGVDLGEPAAAPAAGKDGKPGDKKPAPVAPKKVDPKAKVEPPKPKTVNLDGFRDMSKRWDDGAYDVAWRAVPPELISARGTPLEVLLFPRRETCAYMSTTVKVAKDQPLVFHVAAAGSVRATLDGAVLGTSEEYHSNALADRIAAKVDVAKGDHLFTLKVCAGPQSDTGRVRARVTQPDGEASADVAFSDNLASVPKEVTPPKVTALETPLAHALNVDDKSASVDDALSAALARKLGGADDTRSPRVQGFLDTVVHANPRPDVLAIAGWLAPNRAHETAWLGLALARAKDDAAYEPVARFARRALARTRFSAGYTDWASTTVATTELKTATDLDAQQIRAELLERLGQNEQAYQAYKGIWDANGAATPTRVLRRIADGGFGRPVEAAKARAQALTIWPRESAGSFVSSKRLTGQAAVKQATIDSFRLLTGADELQELASTLKGAGLTNEYRRFLLMSTEWAPNRKEIWLDLTQALAASPEASDKELAKRALERARELDPGSPFLRAEQTLVYGEEHPDDEQFLPKPESFLARRKGAPKPAAGGPEPLLEVYDRQLDWVRVVTIDDAGRVSQLIHYSREIVKAPKDQSDLDENQVPNEGDIVEVVRARVHRADGTIAVPQEINEGGGASIRWTDLKPGDVVEVATRSYTEMPIGERSAPPFSFMDFAGGTNTRPLMYNEVIVRSPKRHPFYSTVVHDELGKPDVRTSTVDKAGRNVDRYVWNNPITLPEEPLAPPNSEIYPTIIGSQFKNWDEFIAWYKSGVDLFSKVDPRIQRQADEIVKEAKAKSREEKVQAIFNWVADRIKYVNYQSGEAWLPNRPQNVLDRLEGDCDDKAMLLITLLKAIGIDDAQEVLVQTRWTGRPSLITAKGAVVPWFDHGIAFLPGKGKEPDRYLDATSPESRIGPLPSMDARAVAIRVPEKGSVPLVTLPSTDPSEHGTEGTWTFTMKGDGAADIAIDETHVGDSAFFLRTSLKQMEAAPSWLEKYHDIAFLPQIEVEKTGIDFKGEGPNGKATLKFKARSAALARREGTDLVLGVRWGAPLVPTYAPLVKRVTPVSLPPNAAPSQDVVTGVVVLPPGYKLGELTAGGNVDGGAYGRASLTIEKGKKEGTVVVKRMIVLDQSLISVAEYDSWRSFLAKVDALFRREIRLVKA
jgi:hypothetical protein